MVIEGSQRPQLTLVDLPGIIQSETKDGSSEDVRMVAEITEHYISQHRTIFLAVVSALHHYANQSILNKVRFFDPDGERTLGIITKPDALPRGSGSERSVLQLAKNQDAFFQLGWHVLKNRNYDEESLSLEERNASEARFFRTTVFKELPRESVGVHSLTKRLSQLLFAHVQQEFPKLQEDLETALTSSRTELEALGISRSSRQDCRAYLMQLSLNYYERCKAAVGGHYEGDYFNTVNEEISTELSSRRLRAVVQNMNIKFADEHRTKGHKFYINWFDGKDHKFHFRFENESNPESENSSDASDEEKKKKNGWTSEPRKLTNKEALDWVSKALTRSRGKEFSGNFNPLVIGELFWEQSSKWKQFAMAQIDRVINACSQFLSDLLEANAGRTMHTRLWPRILDALKVKRKAAIKELECIMADMSSYPINYNHYYTDTIKKRRRMRGKDELVECIKAATTYSVHDRCKAGDHTSASVDAGKAIEMFSHRIDPDMEKHTCEEVLDCLYSIYKVSKLPKPGNHSLLTTDRLIKRCLWPMSQHR